MRSGVDSIFLVSSPGTDVVRGHDHSSYHQEKRVEPGQTGRVRVQEVTALWLTRNSRDLVISIKKKQSSLSDRRCHKDGTQFYRDDRVVPFEATETIFTTEKII